jgi:hypothetical protein
VASDLQIRDSRALLVAARTDVATRLTIATLPPWRVALRDSHALRLLLRDDPRQD